MIGIRHAAIAALSVLGSSAASADEAVDWADLFSWLDLGRSGLESTRDAVGRKEWTAAAEAFAAHLRGRKTPVYPPFATGAARPAPGPDDRAAWERILRHETTIGGVTANPGFPVIDWDFPPGTDREWKWGLNPRESTRPEIGNSRGRSRASSDDPRPGSRGSYSPPYR